VNSSCGWPWIIAAPVSRGIALLARPQQVRACGIDYTSL